MWFLGWSCKCTDQNLTNESVSVSEKIVTMQNYIRHSFLFYSMMLFYHYTVFLKIEIQ